VTGRRVRARGALGWGAGALLFALGCARGAAPPAAPPHDAPVSPAEPRAELELVLSLPAAPDCEERFDLALYQGPGVELIAWDERAGRCEDRRATIRYYPRRLDRDALLVRVRELAAAAQPVAGPETE